VRNEELLAMLRRNRRSFLFVFAFLTSGAVALSFKYQVPPLGDAFLNLWLSFLYAQVVLLPSCARERAFAACCASTRCAGSVRAPTASNILHMIAAGVLHGFLLRRPPGLYSPDSALVTLFALLLTLALAELSFRFFEAPFLRLGQRLRYAPAPARAAQPQGALVPEGTG
jgi:peptidoglycan/LPS O-acetylase OafA/YrhL